MVKIRLWTLGNLEHKIQPTQEAVDKLADILKGVENDECADIIWGPDLSVTEVGGDAVENLLVDSVVESEDGEITITAKRIT